VVLNRTGTAQTRQCTVTKVRPGQTFYRTDTGAPGAGNDPVKTVVTKTVFVNVVC
jgi:hypothetical protein